MVRIGVIGSLNMDLTATVPRFHAPGETMLGTGFSTFIGGKGSNQSVAASRLGAEVLVIGKLGDDANGTRYLEELRTRGIRTDGVEIAHGTPTGVALIEVDPKGENRIILILGANALVDAAQIDRHLESLAQCDTILLQLEVPLPTVEYAVRTLHEMGKRVILDPAPAMVLSDAFLSTVDYITPNETELALLSGMAVETENQILAAARKLLDRRVRTVVVKVGARGAMIVKPDGHQLVPGFKVRAVDTTAAGDSFNAGLGVALSEGLPLPEAVRFANAVGALSTTAMGAQAGMPTRAQVEALMRSNR
jgi:ribokinase